MSAEIEKMNGVKLPSGSTIQVENKNDAQRVRDAFKSYGEITDGVAKKLAAFVVRHKGQVLAGVVDAFRMQYATDTEMVFHRNVMQILGFPVWCK